MELVETQRARANLNTWKAQLAKDIINLEDNLDAIYVNVGLKAHRIVQDNQDDDDLIGGDVGRANSARIAPNDAPGGQKFETIVDEYFNGVKQSATNICNLISLVTEHDLPVPVDVILRLAARVGAIRWSDYNRKIPGSMVVKYIYSKSEELIRTSLMVYSCISSVLSTNIIPFQPFINQNLLSILEWTRTSDLYKHNQAQYFSIRSQAFGNINRALQQLSLNLNLESKQLKCLIESELLHDVEELSRLFAHEPLTGAVVPTNQSNGIHQQDSAATQKDRNYLAKLKDMYAIDTMCCLEQIFVVYSNFLEASLEYKIKNFVVQTCIRIYRDFEKNVIGLACRRQLLCLLETIANSPHSSSTTELAWHVFELAAMHETDPDIKYQTKRALKLGLAHRPIMVSHQDVVECYGRPMTNILTQQDQQVTERAEQSRQNGLEPQVPQDQSVRQELAGPADRQDEEMQQEPPQVLPHRQHQDTQQEPQIQRESQNQQEQQNPRSQPDLQDRRNHQEQHIQQDDGDKLVQIEGHNKQARQAGEQQDEQDTLVEQAEQELSDSQLDQTIFVLSPNGTVTEKVLELDCKQVNDLDENVV